ncbi:glutamine synthetase, partial [Pseudomonas sp. AF1]|nr:glutamine synthetase [Pseudomonas sp. AF1]
MNFACEQEAQDFLAANPDIELFELFILDANGVPRGKLLHRDELLAVYRSGRPLPSTILGLEEHPAERPSRDCLADGGV